MKLLFIHGWSVRDTNTYGELPEVLIEKLSPKIRLDVHHVYLGRYVSFQDQITMDDLARAFDIARKDVIKNDVFSCITHSTGGPVIREWINRYYGENKLIDLPLKHLIMLAPANHGSALAQLGKSKVSRIKAWYEGVQPGQKILDWLELGSIEQRKLNLDWLKYRFTQRTFFPIVITGEAIDKSLFDYLNTYTAEKGSDGVVRACATNLNYNHIKLIQDIKQQPTKTLLDGQLIEAHPLLIKGKSITHSPRCAFEIIPNTSHSGENMGIMKSVNAKTGKNIVVNPIIDALQVKTTAEYQDLTQAMDNRTNRLQKGNKSVRGVMLVFSIFDDRNNAVTDFDMYLLATNKYSPEKLPKGFFIDRQKNKLNRNQLTYYLNNDKLTKIKDGKIGILLVARPDEGVSYYSPAVFQSHELSVTDIIKPNQTLLIDIVLTRHVDKQIFRFDELESGRRDFTSLPTPQNDVP